MSRITGATLAGAIITTLEDLKEYCAFDEDISGGNGPDYTAPEALELGFASTGDYIFDKAVKSDSVFQNQIENALKAICETEENYTAPTVVDLLNGSYYAAIVMLH